MSQSSLSTEVVAKKKRTYPPFLQNAIVAIAGNLGGLMADPDAVGRAIKKYAGTYVTDEGMLVLPPTHLICAPEEYANPGKKGTDN
jgi:hypothetical protein